MLRGEDKKVEPTISELVGMSLNDEMVAPTSEKLNLHVLSVVALAL